MSYLLQSRCYNEQQQSSVKIEPRNMYETRVYWWGGMRFDILIFLGQEPEGWITEIERFFSIFRLMDKEKVDMAIDCFEGFAMDWYQWESRTPFYSWRELKNTLLNRFSYSRSGLHYDKLSMEQRKEYVEFFRSKYCPDITNEIDTTKKEKEVDGSKQTFVSSAFSGGLLVVDKRKMEVAELERVQCMHREQEDSRRGLAEEARAATWRVDEDRTNDVRRAEKQGAAREKEKQKHLLEEKIRKQAAKQKLLELEERMTGRQVEKVTLGRWISTPSTNDYISIKEQEFETKEDIDVGCKASYGSRGPKEKLYNPTEDTCMEEGNGNLTAFTESRVCDEEIIEAFFSREEIATRGFDYAFIKFESGDLILKEKALSANQFEYNETYAGMTSQLCDLNSVEDEYWRAKNYSRQVGSCIEVAIQRQTEQLSIEVGKIDALIMRNVTGKQHLELKLEPVCAHAYQSILFPLVNSYLKVQWEDRVENDAIEKSDVAREAFLIELELDLKKGIIKWWLGQVAVVPEDADELRFQDEDFRQIIEMIINENKLQLTLEYHKQIEGEINQEHLLEQNMESAQTTSEEPHACFAQLPGGYNGSMAWPTSRDKTWSYNVPHTLPGEFLTFRDVARGKQTRGIRDNGIGGYLFERDVLAMSLAQKDEQEAFIDADFWLQLCERWSSVDLSTSIGIHHHSDSLHLCDLFTLVGVLVACAALGFHHVEDHQLVYRYVFDRGKNKKQLHLSNLEDKVDFWAGGNVTLIPRWKKGIG